MKIALAQINTTVGDFSGNREKILAFASDAKDLGCDLVVFPELVLCGYPPKDLLERKGFLHACENSLDILVNEISGIGVIVGVARALGDSCAHGVANVAVLFEDGNILHTAQKRLLPNYDVFDETRYFVPGKKAEAFSYKGHKIGLTICEDAWNVPEFFGRTFYDWDPVAALAKDGADLLINVAASPFHLGKRSLRRKLMEHLSAKYAFHAVYVNQVGGNDHLLFDGSSSAHNPKGELVAGALGFAEDMVCYDTKNPESQVRVTCESGPESVYQALVMGTKDYVHKCGFQKAVIGLSGGIDSALVLCIAAKALGSENVSAIFMPSPYTSQQNFIDTKELADNLGVYYEVCPIDPMFQAFLGSLKKHCNPDSPGVMEQNIQARVRGTILMAFSNQYGAMVLSTGNKSELAVGYCTLYGDMSGGLAVISDVPKELVYDVSEYINKDGIVIPQSILTKAPSAELAPNQADSDDLPEYPVLDPILHAFVEENKDPQEIVAMGFDKDVVADVVRRVTRNEYKRQQAAPGLRITSKAFGEGRRYPLAQRFAGQDS